MKIARNIVETVVAPPQMCVGDVYLDVMASPSDGSRIHAVNVHFAPGARTAWHTHPHGQTIVVTAGIGLCQRRGGPVEVIRPGDRVFFEPGEDHWHGASPDRLMAHIAIVDVGENGSPATWGDPVTDEEYGQHAAQGRRHR